jgi:pyruvate/2-oxoacid:ferredoxin oxidoreductase beta subunit
MPLIMLMHGVSYVATATMAYYEDYVLKLEKAKEAVKHGMAYIHLHTPCSIGWRAPAEKSIEMSRLAVQTNYFPLWEAEDGALKFTKRVKKPKPLKELIKLQKRFSHINDQELGRLKQTIDKRLALLDKLAAE